MPKETFYLICTLLFIIFSGIVLMMGFYIIKRCGSPLPKLFYEFDKKIWMTLGLGIIFFGSYFGLITLLSWLLSSDNAHKMLSFLYRHKVESIYVGLFTFAFLTLSIYLARLLIKFLYSKSKKF